MVLKLMEQIRTARPKKLYISSDAARQNHSGEKELIVENRKIVNHVDWDCEVFTLFQEKNLGTRYAMYEAITWFFQNEPEGIILEEDCLPNQSFFNFCSYLLEYYRNDPRIMHIAGSNQQFGNKIGSADYYFSAFPAIWGWAGWRRVWEQYDLQMKIFPKMKKQGALGHVFHNKVVENSVYDALELTYNNVNMTWDHQLGLTIIKNNGLCIVPNVNLVSNVGVKKVGPKEEESVVSNIATEEMNGEIKHPAFFIPNRKADINHISWSYEDTTTENKVLFTKARK